MIKASQNTQQNTEKKRLWRAARVHLTDRDVSDAEITEAVLTSHRHLPPKTKTRARIRPSSKTPHL